MQAAPIGMHFCSCENTPRKLQHASAAAAACLILLHITHSTAEAAPLKLAESHTPHTHVFERNQHNTSAQACFMMISARLQRYNVAECYHTTSAAPVQPQLPLILPQQHKQLRHTRKPLSRPPNFATGCLAAATTAAAAAAAIVSTPQGFGPLFCHHTPACLRP